MATTPLGNWSLATDAVRDTFANVSAFRTWVSNDGNPVAVALAKTKVHVESKASNGLTYPHIVLEWRSFRHDVKTEAFDVGLSMSCLFECKNKEVSGSPDEFYYIMNPVGLILDGFMEAAGVANTAGYLCDPQFSLEHAPRVESEGVVAGEKCKIMFCRFTLTWGTP